MKPYYPGNGTDGDVFQDNNCGICYKSPNCTILLKSLVGEQPKQWVYNESGMPICTSLNPNRPKRKKKKDSNTNQLFND